MPERIRLSREKGWRMPPGSTKVDRSTRWGNPWRVGELGPLGELPVDAAASVALFEAMLRDPDRRAAVGFPADLTPLSGLDLGCWCAIGAPCHADVLLREANR